MRGSGSEGEGPGGLILFDGWNLVMARISAPVEEFEGRWASSLHRSPQTKTEEQYSTLVELPN